MPTARAREIAKPIRGALNMLHSALASGFDPATSDRGFTVALDTTSALVLAAPLARHVAAAAPGIRLDIVPSGTLDLVDRLDRGDLDLAVTTALRSDQLSAAALFHEGYAVMSRRSHPAAAGAVISVDDLAAFPHLRVSSTADDHGFIDAELFERGLFRQVALRAPLNSTEAILTGSDLLAVVSERTALCLTRATELKMLALPFEAPKTTTEMSWHRRSSRIPANRWLRCAVEIAAQHALTLFS